MRVRRLDRTSLVAGVVTTVAGLVLLLDRLGAIDVRFEYGVPLLSQPSARSCGRRARRSPRPRLTVPRWRRAASAQLRRDADGAVLAGVAAGLARRLGVDPLIIRVALVAASFAGGFGLALYLLGWALMPGEDGEARRSSGSRGGARPGWWWPGWSC